MQQRGSIFNFILPFVLLCLLFIGGCEVLNALGRGVVAGARATTQASTQPIVKDTAAAIPGGSMTLEIATAIAALIILVERVHDRSTRGKADGTTELADAAE